jgi:hypothetical protein
LFKSLKRLARDDVTSETALLVFRTPSGAEFQLPEVWQLERKLDYSRMEVHWFRKQAQPATVELLEEATADDQPESEGSPSGTDSSPADSEQE